MFTFSLTQVYKTLFLYSKDNMINLTPFWTCLMMVVFVQIEWLEVWKVGPDQGEGDSDEVSAIYFWYRCFIPWTDSRLDHWCNMEHTHILFQKLFVSSKCTKHEVKKDWRIAWSLLFDMVSFRRQLWEARPASWIRTLRPRPCCPCWTKDLSVRDFGRVTLRLTFPRFTPCRLWICSRDVQHFLLTIHISLSSICFIYLEKPVWACFPEIIPELEKSL